MTIYFDDLSYDGKRQDFAAIRAGSQSGNRATYEETTSVGAHDFGFSRARTTPAGMRRRSRRHLWRSGKYAYYADKVGPLTLERQARGQRQGRPQGRRARRRHVPRLVQQRREGRIAPDDRHSRRPRRRPHARRPLFPPRVRRHAHGKPRPRARGAGDAAGQDYDWTLVYDPAAESGSGAISVTLGDETVTMPLKQGIKAKAEIQPVRTATPTSAARS